MEVSYTVCGNVKNSAATLENSFSINKVNRELPYDQLIFLGIYLRELKIYIHIKTMKDKCWRGWSIWKSHILFVGM